MPVPHQEIVTSLAILMVQRNQGTNFLDNFLPFVAECIRVADEDIITPNLLNQSFRSIFGFSVPYGVVNKLIRKASKQGFVRIENGIVHRVREKLDSHRLDREREDALRKFNNLSTHFSIYVQEHFGKECDNECAGEILHNVIREQGGLPKLKTGGGEQFEITDRYMAAAFVNDIVDNDPSIFRQLEDFVQASMLASILHFEYVDTDRIFSRWDNVSIVLDTPLLLRVIGFYGQIIRQHYKEVLDTLTNNGARLICWLRTFNELQGVLNNSRDRIISGNFNYQSKEKWEDELITSGMTKADIDILIGKLDHSLRNCRIKVEEEPDVSFHNNLDVTRAHEVFRTSINYMRDETREHDVEAVLATYRKRKGHQPFTIEKCVAVFITINRGVIRASNNFFGEQQGYKPHIVPVCMHFDDLSAYVWLKNPTVMPSFSRNRILADAYAALKPTDEVWNKYQSEIERQRNNGTITGDDVYVLRSESAIDELMNITHNDPALIIEGETVPEILHRAYAKNRRAIEEEKRIVEEEKKETEEKNKLLEEHTEKLRADIDQKDQKTIELKNKVENLTKQQIHIQSLANKWGSRARKISQITLYIIFIGATFAIGIVSYKNNFLIGTISFFLVLIAMVAVHILRITSAIKQVNTWSTCIGTWVESKLIDALSHSDK